MLFQAGCGGSQTRAPVPPDGVFLPELRRGYRMGKLACSMDRNNTTGFKILMCLLLAAAAVAAFWPVLHLGFINFDDNVYVRENPHVLGGLSWENVRWAWSTGEAANWHPLTWMSHMLDVDVSGPTAAAQHTTNLVLHVANVLLLFLLLAQLTGAGWRSAVVAALFGLHPLHVESVTWISERKDVLSAFFFFLALWSYAGYVSHRTEEGEAAKNASSPRGGWSLPGVPAHWFSSPGWFYGLSLGFFALGLMSKPMVVTLPFVLLLLDYWPLQRLEIKNQGPGAKSLRALFKEKLPFFGLAAASCLATFVAQRRAGAVAQTLPFLARAENAVVSYARYVGKTFWPANLCILYPHPTYWPAVVVVVSGLVVAALCAVAVLQWQRRPWVAVGWFWFLGTLVPAIGLVQVGAQAMADRYTYLPGIGLFIAVVWTVHELAERALGRTEAGSAEAQTSKPAPPVGIAFPAFGVAVTLVFLALSRHQLGYWKDSETIFRHTIKVTKNNSFAHGNLAQALVDEGNIPEAIKEYREAIRLWPDDSVAYNTLGNLLASEGKFDEAIVTLQGALKRRPKDAYAHSNLGLMLIQRGRTDEAVAQFRQAVTLAPHDANFQNNLGAALARKGELDEAIVHYQEAIRIWPDFAKAHQSLGVALGRKGRLDESINELQRALQLQPDYPEARQNLALAMKLKERAAAAQRAGGK